MKLLENDSNTVLERLSYFLELVNSTNVLIILEHFGTFQVQNKLKKSLYFLFKFSSRTYLVLK